MFWTDHPGLRVASKIPAGFRAPHNKRESNLPGLDEPNARGGGRGAEHHFLSVRS